MPSLTTLASEGPSWWTRLWFREAGSTFAAESDLIYYFIFWVSAVFFVLLVALMVVWGLSYRRSKVGEVAPVSASHNAPLELAWSIVPAILMAVMFFWGFKHYMNKLVAPVDAKQVYVTAYQWGWDFTYPDGGSTIETETIAAAASPVLGFPVGTPVQMIMTSRDVIHSFYVPAFRVKRDIFPNRYTTLWFESTDEITHVFDETDKALVPVDPDRPGYYLFCAEYCGDQHSQMAGRIAILSQADYVRWRGAQNDTSGINLIDLGAILYKTKGCVQCHSIDGAAKQGPTWEGLWSREHPGWNGYEGDTSMEAYVREAILEPNNYGLPGYTLNMPSYQGQLTQRELLALTMYMKWLDPAFSEEAEQEAAAELVGQAEDGGGSVDDGAGEGS